MMNGKGLIRNFQLTISPYFINIFGKKMPQNDELLALKIPGSLKLRLYSLFPDVKVRNQKIRELLHNLVNTKTALSPNRTSWQQP